MAKATRKTTSKTTTTKKTTNSGISELVANTMLMRSELLNKLLDPRRDIDDECGYPKEITAPQYRYLYDREGIAERVVSVFPSESWAVDPVVYETEDTSKTPFEEAWDTLVNEQNVFHFLYRIDELSGIGRFGILLIGIDDGLNLDQPVELQTEGQTEPKNNLIYLMPLDESVVEIKEYETNVSNARYGKPTYYSVTVSKGGSSESVIVHWSRVLHVADNRKTSEVFGAPRMRPVYNRLYDLRKLLGGSAEMFWKGAFPGLAFEVNPDLTDVDMDTTAMREEFQAYANGLQRYLAITGVTAKSLAPQVASPLDHFETQLKAICVTLGIPQRIFLGTEAGHLASDQDQKTWNKRIRHRQEKYLTPMVIRPFVERLIAMGVLPAPKEFFVKWEDLETTDEKDKAETAGKWTDALAKYIAGNVEVLVPPKEYLTIILGMNEEQADSILEAAERQMAELEQPEQPQQPQQPQQPPVDENQDQNLEQ